MNTHILVGAVVGLLVIVGGGYFLLQHQSTGARGMSDTSGTSAGAQADSSAGGTPGTFSGTMADLSKRGGNWKCTIDTSATTGAGAIHAKGVAYVAGKNVRVDMTVQVPVVGEVAVHLLTDGADAYSWTSMRAVGVRSPLVAQESASASAPTSDAVAGAYNTYAYTCEPATADMSRFVVPTNITFQTVAPR